MKQFLVIGAGKFGASIATTFFKLGHDVMVVDENEDALKNISDSITHAIIGNAADEKTMESLGVNNFDVIVISMGSDIQSSMLITIMIKELGAKYIVAKAQNDLHAKVLKKIGADKIIFPERDMGVRLAQSLFSTNIMDYIELSKEYSLMEVAPFSDWIGCSLMDLSLRKNYGINIVAIKKEEEINLTPTADTIIGENDTLIVVGNNGDLRKIEKIQ